MKLLSLCLSSAAATLAIKTSAVSGAGADVPSLFIRKTNLADDRNNALQANPRRLSTKNSVTCEVNNPAEAEDRTAVFSEKTLQASFTCGEGYTALVPDCAGESTVKCCENPECTNEGANIATVLEVQGKAVKNNQEYTVTLERIPDKKRGQKIYYKCKKNGSELCVVALALPSIDQNACAVDRVLSFSLGKAKPSGTFKCADGTVSSEAFTVSKGACTDIRKDTNAVKLTDLKTQAKEYQLDVGQLPNQAEQLCYKCTYKQVPTVEDNATKKDRTCSVIVTVEAAASSTSTPTTTGSARSILTASGTLNIFLIATFLTAAPFN